MSCDFTSLQETTPITEQMKHTHTDTRTHTEILSIKADLEFITQIFRLHTFINTHIHLRRKLLG